MPLTKAWVPLAATPGEATRSRTVVLALAAVLLLGAAIRLWGLFHDLPFSYYGDELHLMKRSMAMGTGDLNPHWFHKPALFMYLWLFAYGLYFLVGRVTGQFGSTAEFGAHFLSDPGPFLLIGRLVVLLAGVAAVYVVYRIARRVYDSDKAGLAAGLVAAVLAPMVASSQNMKTDVPAGLMIALAVLAYLRTRDDARLRPLLVAGLLAGAAMGTHYYGIVLVPAFLAMELWNGLTRRFPWRQVILRGALVPALFVAGFFVTSPYNLLDPTWSRATFKQLENTFFPEPEQVLFEPDSKVVYEPGSSEALGGATADYFRVLTSPKGLSLPLTVLALLGLGAALANRETRWYGLLVSIPLLVYFFAAVTVAAYHVQPRHLNAIFPLLATLVWPGALLLARLVPAASLRSRLALALVVLAVLPTAAEAARRNVQITRRDSRLESYRWIVASLPRDERILLDDYGPTLQPNPASVARQQAILRTIPKGPFTYNQSKRLQLLRQFPPAEGMDILELGHSWWLPREKSDAELRRDPVDLDMGSPLVTRQPKPLAEYRAEGIRFVVTNSEARAKYFGAREQIGRNFPSFRRFYGELAARKPIRTFDPAQWGGKGPVVWVYDLASPVQNSQK